MQLAEHPSKSGIGPSKFSREGNVEITDKDKIKATDKFQEVFIGKFLPLIGLAGAGVTFIKLIAG